MLKIINKAKTFAGSAIKFGFSASNDSLKPVYDDKLWDTTLKHSPKPELKSLDKTLEAYLPAEELKEVRRILYGNPVSALSIPEAAQNIASKFEFEILGYKIPAAVE